MPASHDSQAIVDLRSARAYARERPRGAVRMTLADVAERAYLLPPRAVPLVLVGGAAETVAPVVALLREAGRSVRHLPGETWRETLAPETGDPSRTRLWREAFVVRYAARHWFSGLPGRSALDVASGTGRNAVFLAMEGFEVTAVDRLPDALERARDLAARHAVAIRTLQRDLERPGALDDLRADVVVVVRYLERALFPALQAAVRPGGLLLYETFSHRQAERGHPRNPRYLLRPGELARAFPQLQVLEHAEAEHDGADVEWLIARRPGADRQGTA